MERIGSFRAGLVILGLALAVGLSAVVVSPSPADDLPDPIDGGEIPEAVGTRSHHPPGLARRAVTDRVPVLYGNCVAVERSAPLDGAVWRWRLLDGVAPESRRSGVAIALTLPAERGDLAVRIDAPGRVPVRCRVAFGPDADIDLGIMALRKGSEVRGVLRDSAGRPFAGARVCLFAHDPVHRTGPMIEVQPCTVVTGVDGAFRLPDPAAAGVYGVVLRDAPPLVSDGSIRIEVGKATTVLGLTCMATSPSDQIRGRTLDNSGRAATGVVVQAAREDGNGIRASALSRSDGSFVLYRPPDLPRDRPVFVSVSSFRGGEQHGRMPRAWGRAGLELVLRAAHRLRVEVVEAATGEPVRAFAVQCFPMVGARVGGNPMRVDGDHDGGIAWVPELRPGLHLVVVHPRGVWEDTCVATLPIPFVVPENGEGILRVELQDSRPLEVLAVHADGTAVEGSTVELFALRGPLGQGSPGPARGRLTGATMVTNLSKFFDNGGGRGAFAVRVATGRTDGHGFVRLDWCPSDMALTLRITGRHAAYQRDDLVFARADQTERVVIERGGSLRGRLTPKSHLEFVHHFTAGERDRLDFLRRHATEDEADRFWRLRASGLVLVENGGAGRRLPWRRRDRFPVDENGRFAIEGIPAGTWSVFLERRSPKGTFDETARPFARLQFQDGQELEEDLDLRGHVESGVVSGEVQHNGRPLRDAEVRVTWRRRSGVRVTAGIARSDGAGSFCITQLAPRRYQLRVQVGKSSLAFGEEFELPAGGRHEQAFSLLTSAVRLHLRNDSGPVVRQRVELRAVGAAGIDLRWRRRTDELGLLVLQYVPPGRYQIVDSDGPVIVVRPGMIQQEFKRRL